jgi:predicted membrane channel-forming protein YqfA (hemolysin III family)
MVESGGEPGENKKERIDRELNELLQELRVAIPGVQVLFAFLLTLPFTQGFGRVEDPERAAYFACLLCVAGATALLITPSSYHRINFRVKEKERILFTSNRLALIGLLLLATAISLAIFVITTVLFSRGTGVIVAVGTFVWFAWFWYGLPIMRRVQKENKGTR